MYHIRVHGRVDEEDINALCPLKLSMEQRGDDSTLFRVHTDQSGMIGLMRCLHGLGFTILSFNRNADKA